MSGKGKRKKPARKKRSVEGKGAEDKKSQKDERLAQALRDNLRRRKDKGGHHPGQDSQGPAAKAFARKSTRGR